MRDEIEAAEREHPGLAMMRIVVRDELTALTAALREFYRKELDGFEKIENRLTALEQRIEQVERAMKLSLEQLVELRKQMDGPRTDPDDWWRKGSDES